VDETPHDLCHGLVEEVVCILDPLPIELQDLWEERDQLLFQGLPRQSQDLDQFLPMEILHRIIELCGLVDQDIDPFLVDGMLPDELCHLLLRCLDRARVSKLP